MARGRTNRSHHYTTCLLFIYLYMTEVRWQALKDSNSYYKLVNYLYISICLLNIKYILVHLEHLLETCQLFPKEVDDHCTENKTGKYCK